ncbi:MAG: sigma-70 family RNA polymerase sigma factor [Isosphaeraceae bacterium]
MTTPKALLNRPDMTRNLGAAAPCRVKASTRPAPLDEVTKAQIHGKWRRGVAAEMLAEQYGRSVAVIDRAINEVRAIRILEQKHEYVDDPEFSAADAEAKFLGPVPANPSSRAGSKPRPPAGLPPYLASLYGDAPLLNREQEAHLFRKMNYLKYRVAKLRETLDPSRARATVLDEIERLQEEALAVKNQIIRANLRLVVSIAKKRVGPTGNFFELVSDGNMSLIRAVEKFDAGRGFKFSTYASWAIMKNFARTIPEEKTRRDRFVTGHDEMFEAAADHRTAEHEYEIDQKRNQETVQGMLGKLNDRERQILTSRFGLGGASERTLEQLGKELGITKERVRQIESRAQEKLRKFAMEQKLDPPAS